MNPAAETSVTPPVYPSRPRLRAASRRRFRRATVLITALLILVTSDSAGARAFAEQPNVIVINTDDVDTSMLSQRNLELFLPNIRTLAEEGLTFTNYHVTTPLCGPSRACLFRGQYAHNTGIKTNQHDSNHANGFGGGVEEYFARGHHTDDLPVWMKNAGYRTILVGRHLNGGAPPSIPPGWDHFYATLGNRYYGAVQITNALDPGGSTRSLGSDYRTVVESDLAIALMEESIAQDQAFFLYLAPLAAHNGSPEDASSIELRYRDRWPNISMEWDASFNEIDFNDKPSHFQILNELTADEIAQFQAVNRERILRLKSVDDTVGRILDSLAALDQIDNTYIVFTSDNGFLLGQHRTGGKKVPFERSTRVPLVVWGPGVAAAVQADHLVANIDIAPTVADLAGVAVPDFCDGRSLSPLLFDPEAFNESSWQFAILIENWERKTRNGISFPTEYVSLRLHKQRYTEWANGELEYYDLNNDPFELENVADELTTGDIDFFRNLIDDLREGSPLPATTIAYPYSKTRYVRGTFEIQGFAEDDKSTTQVRLSIREKVGNFYWNGNHWQSDYTHVHADHVERGLALGRWMYTMAPGNTIISTRELVISARAIDSDGNVASQPYVRRVVWDSQEPESSITYPPMREHVGKQLVAQGVASDAQQADHVRLVMRNIDTKSYFDGVSWGADPVQLHVPLESNGNWSYPLQLPAGRYGLTARTYDEAGNFDRTPDATVFFVE